MEICFIHAINSLSQKNRVHGIASHEERKASHGCDPISCEIAWPRRDPSYSGSGILASLSSLPYQPRNHRRQLSTPLFSPTLYAYPSEQAADYRKHTSNTTYFFQLYKTEKNRKEQKRTETEHVCCIERETGQAGFSWCLCTLEQETL